MAFIAARSKRVKRISLSLTPVALAALAASHVMAQEATLPAVVVTSPANQAHVSGFGEVPLSQLPMQASVISASTLMDRDVQRLADVVSLKASVSDAYNAAGYWDMLAIRGFALDNRHNFKRDGLPVNAETLLPLDNKERVEILEGLSGMQAGLSAPGGLVNLVVKRPDTQVRSVTLGWEQSGSVLAAADLSQRFGPQQAFGLRLNVAYQHLDPQLRSASGKRQLFALAGDWRVSPDTLIEAEVESSRRSQPSQPGFSLLGSTLPDAQNIDPRINLNNQPWSLPVVMAGNTGSLRVSQALAGGWKFVGHYAHQELRTDDRLAYPFGCYDNGSGIYYPSSYCPNGSFDYYLFRSDGEHRRNDALQLSLEGRVQTGAVQHNLNVGWLSSYFSLHTNTMPDDGTFVGNGTIDGTTVDSPLPAIPDKPNGTRTERSNELFVRDRARLAANWTAWLGLRATRMTQTSIRTDGSRPVAYSQDFVTPWLALSHDLAAGRQLYASWGQGIETAVTPNKSGYANPGQVLAAVRSHQWEVGYKARYFDDKLNWNSSYFNIHQPNVYDDSVEKNYVNAIVAVDGQQRRQGLETDLAWSLQRWRFDASAMLLDAEVHDSLHNNGNRPTNVPERTLKAQATYRVPTLDGLQLSAAFVHEGNRMVLPDNSVSIPAWTRLDLGLRHEQRLAGTTFTWRAGLYNATDKRAWRESPYQYGHAYLYPLAPRTWRLSLQTDL